jgi:hypothetical protein
VSILPVVGAANCALAWCSDESFRLQQCVGAGSQIELRIESYLKLSFIANCMIWGRLAVDKMVLYPFAMLTRPQLPVADPNPPD